MIEGFGCRETEKIFKRMRSRKFPESIQKVAYRKLLMINAAININDLRVPPANHLESLKGDLKGLYSIRINDQWRICFEWKARKANKVKIIDYH